MLALFVLVAVVGPFFVPYGPTDTIGIREGLVKSGQGIIPGPSGDHWLGFDHQGRDEFSRMIVGARQTLLVGVVSTLIGLAIGALVGGVAGAAAGLGGRWGRWVDTVLMRIVDMLLALPSLLLAVSIAALLGASLTTVMIAVGVVSVPIFARLLRGSMIAQANSDYVLAATSLGVRRSRIALTPRAAELARAGHRAGDADPGHRDHRGGGAVLPRPGQPRLGGAGVGRDARRRAAVPRVSARHWRSTRPSAIIITALGFTLLGEAMREALDPKLRK